MRSCVSLGGCFERLWLRVTIAPWSEQAELSEPSWVPCCMNCHSTLWLTVLLVSVLPKGFFYSSGCGHCCPGNAFTLSDPASRAGVSSPLSWYFPSGKPPESPYTPVSTAPLCAGLPPEQLRLATGSRTLRTLLPIVE